MALSDVSIHYRKEINTTKYKLRGHFVSSVNRLYYRKDLNIPRGSRHFLYMYLYGPLRFLFLNCKLVQNPYSGTKV